MLPAIQQRRAKLIALKLQYNLLRGKSRKQERVLVVYWSSNELTEKWSRETSGRYCNRDSDPIFVRLVVVYITTKRRCPWRRQIAFCAFFFQQTQKSSSVGISVSFFVCIPVFLVIIPSLSHSNRVNSSLSHLALLFFFL